MQLACPRLAPPPTRPPQIWNRTAVRLRFAPSDRGLLLGLNHCRCHRCRLRVFFARFATLRQSPPIAKTKILTFLQLFFSIRDPLPFPQSEKGPFCSFFTAFLGHDLRFFVTRQSAIEKSCILTRFFVSGPLEQFPDGTVGRSMCGKTKSQAYAWLA